MPAKPDNQHVSLTLRWLRLLLPLAALGLSGCDGSTEEPAAGQKLGAVHWPGPTLRQGTRLFAVGRDLAGHRLLLRAADGIAALAVDLDTLEVLPDAAVIATPGATEVASGSVAIVVAPDEGVSIESACLVAAGAAQVVNPADCRAINATWRADLMAVTLQWSGGNHSFGDQPIITTTAADDPNGGLLLPGEGESWLEIVLLQVPAPAPATATVPLLPLLEAADSSTWRHWLSVPGMDRHRRRLVIDPSWSGPTPGPRTLRARLVQRAGGVQLGGPWLEVPLELAAPTLTLPSPNERLLQRGRLVPATITGVPARHDDNAPSGWRLAIAGTWHGLDAPLQWPVNSPRRLPGRALASAGGDGSPQHRALLSSPAWFDGAWPEPGTSQPEIAATFALEVYSPHGSWSQTVAAGRWRLLPTQQRIEPLFGGAFVVGLKRYGLAARATAIAERIRTLIAAHFNGLRVQVVGPEGALSAAEEVVRVAILDRDPNGLDLLGADNSPGKDVGNRDLGEQLLGFAAAARVVGEVAYGGVFLHGFTHFSPTLYPGGLVVDSAFDALFGPWMPELGGKPAAVGDPAAAAASEAMARLIAGSLSHEVGHALGLPAVPGYHHAQDNPGWRMDEGRNRPFAERIGQPGAVPEIWGEVDGAYLKTLLGAAAD